MSRIEGPNDPLAFYGYVFTSDLSVLETNIYSGV